MSEKTFCGVVAVVGAPNAGKSSLVNALVGQKVAIVSPKAQTTRTKLLGVVMGSAVALEVDSHDDRLATSVVVHGIARLLPEDEAHLTEDLLTLPWAMPDTPRYNVVCIQPTSVTGRRFARS